MTGVADDDEYLNVAEVAAALRVSRMSVYRLVHTGELVALRVGRLFRISRRAFDEYRERVSR